MPAQLHRFSTAALVALAAILTMPALARAQRTDSTARDSARTLDPVRVTARVTPKTVTSLPERHGALLLTGTKTEVILIDSMGANAAQNVARQVLGRVPGLVVAETEGAGFPSNGIAVRGLNPTQSIEMNVRQNGVGIAADPYGYPETYYLPPLESVERVEIIRGASGLQFGPQFGGVVNYVMRRGDSSRPFGVSVQQTGGSDGLNNTFGSLSGGAGRLQWFGAVQRKSQTGWRPNSDLLQTTSYVAVTSTLTPTLTATLDYSALRNRIHMPGGLSDDQFEDGARQSFRARNWLTSPWNVTTATLAWTPSRTMRLESVTSYLKSGRSLVWRNEEGGPGALDVIDPTSGDYVNREVEAEAFTNVTEELRLRTDYTLFGFPSTVAAGTRWFDGRMHRQGGGEGTTGSDFDLSLVPGARYEYDIRFTTRNLAAWLENAVRISDRLSIAPGLRIEHLRSTADGYTDTTFAPQAKSRTIPLAGIGVTWIASGTTAVYANASQAYRPLDYSVITPVGSVSRIDPAMRDSRGVSLDLGWRGTAAADRVRFDVGVFHLNYDDRVGLRTRTDPSGVVFTERTNVANSVHQGLESYLEVTPVAAPDGVGTLTVFNSLALTDAHYTAGDVRGHRVEYAPKVVERVGLTLARGPLSTTFLTSHTSASFGDADNTVRSDDAVAGLIPAYTVLDLSGTLALPRGWRLQGGVNNLADRRYFTRRTDEYPGPGILPSLGRSLYVTLRASP
ncbi:MAG: TonB-dependent receptor [Gemmatimonadaceae bacterium]